MKDDSTTHQCEELLLQKPASETKMNCPVHCGQVSV